MKLAEATLMELYSGYGVCRRMPNSPACALETVSYPPSCTFGTNPKWCSIYYIAWTLEYDLFTALYLVLYRPGYLAVMAAVSKLEGIRTRQICSLECNSEGFE
jgi:hypothetical protein